MTKQMNMQQRIETKLREALSATYLEVVNESHGHNVPRGSETHFRVIAVSPLFRGQNAVSRHREIYRALAQELKDGVHALALETLTPEEWEQNPARPSSPPCLGGSKAEKE